MTGRRHAPPDQQQQHSRFACPFAKSDPDTYMSIAACRTTEGFRELRELNEHIWRKHTPFFRCGFCSSRWSISTARGKVNQKKEEHWETCEEKRHGTPYFVEKFDEDGTELLDGDQQQRFAQIKSIRGIDRKLKALYEACDKPVPDDYYAPVALPAAQPQVNYRTVTHTTTTRRVRQPDSHRGSEFLDGFVQPRPEGHHRQSRRRTTATNMSRASAQAAGGYEVSGATRAPDADSGYWSIPGNDRDAGYVSPADGYPAQPEQPAEMYLWGHASSHVSSDAGAAVTAGSGQSTIDNHTYHEYYDYGVVDPSLFSSAGLSSSHRRHEDSQALLGLALPGPGEGDVEERVVWGFPNLDADLPEYSGNQPLE